MNLLDLIKAALKEDMPQGDLTTESLAVKPRPGFAKLLAKQDLILSGTTAFEQTVLLLDPSARLKWHVRDGEKCLRTQAICTIQGDLIQILKAERTALNFLMRLSGIATLTHRYTEAVKHTPTKILDTRKTTPGYRELEKRAVIHGGGTNHRMSLSHAVLVKDNHITLMGGITKAVQRIRQNTELAIEVEVLNLTQLREAIDLGIKRILLDNMSNELMREAKQLTPADVQLEASGNMSLDRVASVAEIGIDFISVGALTHSAPSADISLLFDWTGV